MRNLTLAVFTLYVVSSCDKEPEIACSTVLPPPNYFEINIVDTSGNSLIGNQYTQDSIRLFNSSFEKYIRANKSGLPHLLQIFYPSIESGIEYFIELDSTDSDTLKFSFSIDRQECHDAYTMQAIEYNSQNISISNSAGVFDLLKQ